jgi:uncharacterized protein (TIGR01777 family)
MSHFCSPLTRCPFCFLRQLSESEAGSPASPAPSLTLLLVGAAGARRICSMKASFSHSKVGFWALSLLALQSTVNLGESLSMQFWGGAKAGGGKGVARVAVSGSSGMVGKALCKQLQESGLGGKSVQVVRLVRREARSDDEVSWDPSTGKIEAEKMEGLDALVHLAGEGVASGSGPLAPLGRWDLGKKDAIMNSRVKGTSTLVQALKSLKKPPRSVVCASAVGYYGYQSGDQVLDESSPKGAGFLADVVEKWETEALKMKSPSTKVVCTRFGVILGKEGGIIAKLAPIFSLAAGGNLGSGQQYMSWISLTGEQRHALAAELYSPVTVVLYSTNPSPPSCPPAFSTLLPVLLLPS